MKHVQQLINGVCVLDEFLDDQDLPHNDNGPAFVQRTDDGKIELEISYYIHGDEHNLAGPSMTLRNELGLVVALSYKYKGEYKDGRSYISWHDNGRMECEMFFLNGVLHNEKGAASLRLDEAGTVITERYYLDGVVLEKSEWEKRVRKMTFSPAKNNNEKPCPLCKSMNDVGLECWKCGTKVL